MKRILFLIGICIILLSCKSSKSTAAQIETLDDIIQSQKFTIESTWAYPQLTNAVQQVLNSGLMLPGNTANSISLIGNSNFLTISGDSISSFLPYYGERQMQIDYSGRDNAIQLNGTINAYQATKNKDNSYSINFEAKNNSENFQVFLKLYPNLKANLILNGNSRFPIRYSGNLLSHPEQKTK
ncbi:DUF4251 domain-containing protein [Aquimarina intermedia]|nr:DUF4251 domain-containing protein [Aquimarina intermedia]